MGSTLETIGHAIKAKGDRGNLVFYIRNSRETIEITLELKGNASIPYLIAYTPQELT